MDTTTLFLLVILAVLIVLYVMRRSQRVQP